MNSKTFYYINLHCRYFFFFAACTTPGYFGASCYITCTPGTFGRECAGNCSGLCPLENCHHVFGCPQGSSNAPKPTQSGIKQLLSLSCMYFTDVYNSNHLQLQMLTVTIVCNCRSRRCFHWNIK